MLIDYIHPLVPDVSSIQIAWIFHGLWVKIMPYLQHKVAMSIMTAIVLINS